MIRSDKWEHRADSLGTNEIGGFWGKTFDPVVAEGQWGKRSYKPKYDASSRAVSIKKNSM